MITLTTVTPDILNFMTELSTQKCKRLVS